MSLQTAITTPPTYCDRCRGRVMLISLSVLDGDTYSCIWCGEEWVTASARKMRPIAMPTAKRGRPRGSGKAS